MHVRLWVPEVAQTPLKEHALQLPHIGLPQAVPAVMRGQPWLSERIRPVQVPAWHTRSVQARLWVPDSSQVSEKPPQAP